jgi:hypothetical protein
MKPLVQQLMGRRAFDFGTPAATTLLLLAALTVRADTPYTSTGWVIGAPVPGIWCTNAQGQVIMRGNAHLVRVTSTDPRLTGRRLIFVNGDAQPDASALFSGTSYQETGTWDPAGTTFTPSGGLWETTYRGTMGADGSLQLQIVGYGWGGTIDGLQIEETMTREAGPILDPVIPYHYAGTIKPSSVSTTLFSDDFNDGVMNWTIFKNAGVVTLNEMNGQLVTCGDWTGVTPDYMLNHFFAYRLAGSWNLADRRTLQCQVDLVGISENSRNTASLMVGSYSEIYVFHKGTNAVFLNKYTEALGYDVTTFWCTNEVSLRSTNVGLSIALTRDEANVIITTRVLDRANQNAVLFERSFVDTPQVDASLTKAQFVALTGITTMNLAPDPGAPILSGSGGGVSVSLFPDDHQPPVCATWDNFALQMQEVPPIAIGRSVRLTWPAPAGVNYGVEAAPTVQGPWLPVQELEMPGLQKLDVPQTKQAEFFRLRQTP